MRTVIFLLALALSVARCEAQETPDLETLTARYAQLNGVPKTLVERVIFRESRFNPKAHGRSFWGLMQLRPSTARSLGYRGRPEGLLDPETNLTYGVLYLANAWRVAGGDPSRAIRLYSSGYYSEARRKGRLSLIRIAAISPAQSVAAATPAVPPVQAGDARGGGPPSAGTKGKRRYVHARRARGRRRERRRPPDRR